MGLYCDHVQDLASRSEGFSINSSKQSIMDVTQPIISLKTKWHCVLNTLPIWPEN